MLSVAMCVLTALDVYFWAVFGRPFLPQVNGPLVLVEVFSTGALVGLVVTVLFVMMVRFRSKKDREAFLDGIHGRIRCFGCGGIARNGSELSVHLETKAGKSDTFDFCGRPCALLHMEETERALVGALAELRRPDRKEGKT